MPIIDGVKMACVPCIRGHRSTKCNHANERVMVPVRKPGRPLSVCPHPASKPCTCGVTAAIPKKPACPCGSSSTAVNRGPGSCVTSKQHPPAHETAVSPASTASPGATPAAGPGRINKAQATKNPRKLSFDPSMLQRVDINQANLIPVSMAFDRPGHSMAAGMNGFSVKQRKISPVPQQQQQQQQQHQQQQQIQQIQQQFMANMTSPQIPGMQIPMFGQQIGQPLMTPHMGHQQGPLSTGLDSASSFLQHLSHSSPQPSIKLEPTHSNAGRFNNGNGSMLQEPSTTPVSAAPAKSCCGGGSKTTTLVTPPTTAEPMKMAQTSALDTANLYMPFAYPPQIGSQMQPLNPDQWKAFMDNYSIEGSSSWMNTQTQTQTQTQPQQQPQPQPQPQPTSFNQFSQQTPTVNQILGAVADRGPPPTDTEPCTCGPDCQCLGCWWHPFNQTTTDQVMSAYSAMFDDSLFDERSPLSPLAETVDLGKATNQPAKGSCCGGPPKPKTPPPVKKSCCGGGGGGNGGEAQSPSAGQQAEVESPGVAVTPSDGSGAMEELNLPADTFLFVHYPLHGSCAGSSVTCPCGDDCECLGCVVHGNQ